MSKHRQAVTDLLPAFGNEWSLLLNVLGQVAEVLKITFFQ